MKDINVLVNNGVDVQKSLELFVEIDVYDKTLGDFLLGINEKVENIKAQMEEGDMPEYAILVHSLKSDSKYLGFTKLAELSYQHEMESKANNITFIYSHYNELLAEINKMIKIVQEYLGEAVAEEVLMEKPLEIKEKAILVVDDSDIIRNYIYNIFNNSYEVITVHDGQKAIDIIEKDNNNKIVAMLLDLNMPNVTGFEVLEYFKENSLFVKIPVSIITGDDSKDTIQKAFNYPIADVISKPFNERDIKRVVEKTIEFK
ncbi:MAG: response regulator [Bacilli bacterium]|nr:response regulator [Bacilli bacterium]MDD3304845.1 response regulator [Bacilli bacterium]MDD4053690.1 response regulator [Bacilli bacterium]MDD4411561.1 response regulator [Bacilli bacterium]